SAGVQRRRGLDQRGREHGHQQHGCRRERCERVGPRRERERQRDGDRDGPGERERDGDRWPRRRADQGLIELNESAAEYIEEWAGGDSDVVTIRNLISNDSG